MNNDTRQIIPIAGLIATFAIAAYMVIQLSGQVPATQDFSAAAVAEVHDAQGQLLLRGQFVEVPEQDDDIERKARLEPAGPDQDAVGDAEIEIQKNAPALQEIEFSARNLEPGSVVTFLIDGNKLGQATVDRRGRAKLEIEPVTP